MKDTSEMVWPVENYTDKIHTGLAALFSTYSWLTFTVNQMESHLSRSYKWLTVDTPQRKELLHKLIQTGIRKLIQTGRVQKVTSKVSVEPQWMAIKGVQESSYTNITSEDQVATTPEARKAVNRRSIGRKKLWDLNHKA
jgi:hypothetical protein